MSDAFLRSCKNRLANLISMEAITESENSFSDFADAVRNMYSHYCQDDHTSKWCTHDKVHILCKGKQTGCSLIRTNCTPCWGKNNSLLSDRSKVKLAEDKCPNAIK